MRAFRPRIVINEVRTAEDIRLGFAIGSVCRKYFGIETDYLGYVNHDEAARLAVRERRPLVHAESGSDAAIYIDRIARKLASEQPRSASSDRGAALDSEQETSR
jgi:flagellar biosynthesis protein FlhG